MTKNYNRSIQTLHCKHTFDFTLRLFEFESVARGKLFVKSSNHALLIQ